MYRHLKKKVIVILLLFIFVTSLFVCPKAEAVTDDDGPAVNDSSINWKLTCYGGEALGGTGYNENSFTTNEKYGWCEYTEGGVTYVVLAAATHELLNSGEISVSKKDYIHYFSYYDKIQFTFVDQNFDSNVYNGIILDSCGASMDPTRYGHASNDQILDVYFKSSTYNEDISNKRVSVSMDGTFSSTAGQAVSASRGNFFAQLGQILFETLGDGIQVGLNYIVGDTSLENAMKNLTKSKSDIQADYDLNKEMQVTNPNTEYVPNEDDDSSEYNSIGEKNISSTQYNKKGQLETVYSSNTKIPITPVDFYSTSVALFDINFLDTNNSGNIWKTIVQTASRIIMYIAAVLIITMIIWRAILLVYSSIRENPETSYESRRIMDNIFKSILLLGSIYVFMIILMKFYNEVQKLLLNGNKSIYLLRINVENVYSFNTNIVGYWKYLALNQNVYASLGYSFLYFIVEILNALWYGVMLFRSIVIGVIIILAPLTAVNLMRNGLSSDGGNTTSIFNIRIYLRIYLRILFFPLAMVLLNKIAMLIM